jgi:uncharacterized Tic20 family protein
LNFILHISTIKKQSKNNQNGSLNSKCQKSRYSIIDVNASKPAHYVCNWFWRLRDTLIIWLTKKDEIADMNEHGKSIINFQITMLLSALLSIPLIFAFGLGILTLIFIGVLSFVLPIVNAVRASKGESPSLFCTIEFIK